MPREHTSYFWLNKDRRIVAQNGFPTFYFHGDLNYKAQKDPLKKDFVDKTIRFYGT